MFGEIGDTKIGNVMSKSYCILENQTLAKSSTDMTTYDDAYCDDYKCSDNRVCSVNVYIVRGLLALYMMFSAVLMLNLMVAGEVKFLVSIAVHNTLETNSKLFHYILKTKQQFPVRLIFRIHRLLIRL